MPAKTKTSTSRPSLKITSISRCMQENAQQEETLKWAFKWWDVNPADWKLMTVKREQMSHRVQQYCTPHLYNSHIRPVSVFLAQLYCFSEYQPQIGPKSSTSGGPQTRQTDGERFSGRVDFTDPEQTDNMSYFEKVTREKVQNPVEWQKAWQFWLFLGGNRSVKNVYIFDFGIYRTNEIDIALFKHDPSQTTRCCLCPQMLNKYGAWIPS